MFAVSVSIVKCCQKMLFVDRKMCIWSLAFHWEALCCKVMCCVSIGKYDSTGHVARTFAVGGRSIKGIYRGCNRSYPFIRSFRGVTTPFIGVCLLTKICGWFYQYPPGREYQLKASLVVWRPFGLELWTGLLLGCTPDRIPNHLGLQTTT